ncbi:MAG: HD domain-containing protein [Bacteroidota bacterium]
MNCSIIDQVSKHVIGFLRKHLPSNRTFHDITHTRSVVKAAEEIAGNCNLSEQKKEEIILAAWFHDCGHVYRCESHEDISESLAREFLESINFPKQRIENVVACIRATRLPHQPQTLPEKVMCDADLYHLSIPQYPTVLRKLRAEFESLSHKKFQDDEWEAVNLRFLRNHKYFTNYGQATLESRKQKNIQRLQEVCSRK